MGSINHLTYMPSLSTPFPNPFSLVAAPPEEEEDVLFRSMLAFIYDLFPLKEARNRGFS